MLTGQPPMQRAFYSSGSVRLLPQLLLHYIQGRLPQNYGRGLPSLLPDRYFLF